MVARVWRGWTTPANADRYELLLKEVIFPGIEGRQLAGYRGIELYRRDESDETEFVTTMLFDSLEHIKGFAGTDYEVAVVPERARALLSRFDARSTHYQVRVANPTRPS
ncbi:MAG: antibiotic biosynthesis monooxygenase [Gemmatimonadetes bacterium]|nr:antibiotic biosynthesis monooxygenase [Gemmatimonadota bacterium]